ncbi:hypothetical protein H3H12_25350 [Serratia marcescens]|uniref:hypothetical protein n=1 Tax=Serratia marcescens TaxID=615 RepID=UPI001981C7DA|nr:hypothetical protein [Serratia marcescens]MBN3938277.1 hypothetical protein [Serratia marcescens]
MPNSEHQAALPHGFFFYCYGLLSDVKIFFRWQRQMSGAQQRLSNKTSHANNPLAYKKREHRQGTESAKICAMIA